MASAQAPVAFKFIDKVDDANELAEKISPQKVIALDCESVKLGRTQPISIMSIAVESGEVYLLDIDAMKEIPQTLKTLLEDPAITKVMWDCRSDAECLKFKHNVQLQGMLDLQVAYYASRNPDFRPGKKLSSFLRSVEEFKVGNGEELRNLKPSNEKLKQWAERPLAKKFASYASYEVSLLLPLKTRVLEKASGVTEDKIREWSARYAQVRLSGGPQKYEDPYSSHGFMPYGVFGPKPVGPIECIKCGEHLRREEFSKYQIQTKVPKCVVCKAIKLELDVANNRRENIERAMRAEWEDGCCYDDGQDTYYLSF